jgi:hypothetical protein
MDILDEEVLALWKSLNQNGVKYLMVGGVATNLHGYTRLTADLDLWIEDTLENRKNLRTTLNEIGLGDFEALETTQLIPGWTSISFGSGMELDIMTELAGFPAGEFNKCYKQAPLARIENIPIKFLHINHLIANKKAAARPKDIIDIEELEKIQNNLNL